MNRPLRSRRKGRKGFIFFLIGTNDQENHYALMGILITRSFNKKIAVPLCGYLSGYVSG